MPTVINLAGGASVRVAEQPGDVFDACNGAGGLPFRLTAMDASEIYVNPATVTFWRPAGVRESERPPSLKRGKRSALESWGDDPAAPDPRGMAPAIPSDLAAAFAVLRRDRRATDALPDWRAGMFDRGSGAHYGVNPALSRLAGTPGGSLVWLVPGRSGTCLTISHGGGGFAPNPAVITRGLQLLMQPTEVGQPATFVGVLPDGVSVTGKNTDGSDADVAVSGSAFWVTGSSLSSLTVHTKTAGDNTVLTVQPPTPRSGPL